MKSGRDRDGAGDVDGAVGGGGGAVPGKRTLTQDLPAAAARGVDGPGGAMPHEAAIQASFGADHDVSAMRAHVGGGAAAACDELGAQAYATGQDVAFGGAPDLHTAAHEAAHVVQQRQGVSFYGGGGSSDAFERHADAVADRVVAGGSAADLLAGGGASSAPAVQRKPKEHDVIGTAAEAVLGVFHGPQVAAGMGAEIGTQANIDEAGTDPTKNHLQAFRTAVAAGVVADIESTWHKLHGADKKKLRPETDTITRMIQVWGPQSMHAMAAIGVHFADDPRWAQHILWQANVADWKAQMTSTQWRQFLHADPRQDALDATSIAGLNQAMKVAGGEHNAHEIFDKVYPKLQSNHHVGEDDWTKLHAAHWTAERTGRLFDILSTGGMPRAHVMAASNGFLLVSKMKSREDSGDPWPHKWTDLGYAYWDDSHSLIVLPEWSSSAATDSAGHDMVGGDNARSHAPVSKLTHMQGSAMHEVGHAVGDKVRGHTWAQTQSPAQWHQLTGPELLGLWDSAKNIAPAPGETALPEADAKTYMQSFLSTGTATLPATGWTEDTLIRMLKIQYFEQDLYKLWASAMSDKDSAFKKPVERGGFNYAYLSRWDNQVGRYKKEAFEQKVSWYSLSSPNEWFAEQYVQFYRSNKAGTGMDPATVAYLTDLDTHTVANPGADPAAPAGPAAPAPAPTPGGGGGEAGDREAQAPHPTGAKRPHRRQFGWAW